MLTDTTVRQSKPKDKPYKLTDGGGLYLLINTTGKYWRLNYRFAGKQKTLALGVYPAVSLIDARQKRDQARSQLAKDINPSESRKEQKLQKAIAANNSFEAVSRLWWGHWKHDKTERHANYTIRRMEADIFPSIGHKPVNELTAAQFIAVVREVESRGALDIAKRVLTMCEQVMRYAIECTFLSVIVSKRIAWPGGNNSNSVWRRTEGVCWRNGRKMKTSKWNLDISNNSSK